MNAGELMHAECKRLQAEVERLEKLISACRRCEICKHQECHTNDKPCNSCFEITNRPSWELDE